MGTLSLIQNSSSGILRFIILTFLAMKDTYGKTSTGMTKFTKGVTKRFNNAGANLSRVGSNLISSNKKKNDNPIIHSTTTANLQSHQQNNLPMNLASSVSMTQIYYSSLLLILMTHF